MIQTAVEMFLVWGGAVMFFVWIKWKTWPNFLAALWLLMLWTIFFYEGPQLT